MYAREILDELVSWTPGQLQPDRLRAEVRLEARRGRWPHMTATGNTSTVVEESGLHESYFSMLSELSKVPNMPSQFDILHTSVTAYGPPLFQLPYL